ncbi:EF-hand domain-containing protein [Saccharothrix coeruleofusca]|uniref:EF-hand domain-containing protein n=1 Tax=Saccharothrix coeruleofusca TaxID=33919 RepID=A0A918AQ55_9PSEU|nr:EF-hand domain-containing protein [Saccharothrix coeruleofusca]GGP68181.1 hypothetical protein GCM10010185_46250 [Saccharothrix coeruleofusca]
MPLEGSPQLEARLEKLFKAIDRDGSGCVERSDYERVVDRYNTLFEVDPESPEGQELLGAHMMLYSEVVRHAQGHDRVSKQEYVSALLQMLVETNCDNLLMAMPNAVFDVIDRNDDDMIDEQEFRRFLQVWQIDSPATMEVFTRLDTDRDGQISRHEYVSSWRDFFSDSTTAPGTLYCRCA